MAETTALVVENLTFQYISRPTPALKGLSFELRPGEMLLVAGASGCGKTTLARCINGLIPRSYRGQLQGSVLLWGRPTAQMSLREISQTVGMVLQDPERQIVGSTVLAEVAFGPENLGLAREEIERRIDEVLQRLGIPQLRLRDTFALSGGEKQKVALAGALAMRPSILLLDEPLASLDPASSREALALFRRLAEEGTTIVMIEHRVEDALVARPDRVMYLQEGEVAYLGGPEELPQAVDWHEVKLPVPVVLKRARAMRASAPRPEAGPAPARVASAGEPLVVFEDVSFGYGGGPDVLHNVNLEIRRGETIALLGPNGVGKSTLVKHAIGLLKPRRGRVRVEGHDTRECSVAQIAHTLGYVFQSPGHMLFATTVYEELAFGPRNLRMAAAEVTRNVDLAVAMLGLGGLEKYPPLALSYGQQKRVTIAAVVAMRSKILVLDEPTAGQDYGHYMHFMDSICGAGERPLDFDAILFITHDLDLAISYANRVILMRDGCIAGDGAPEAVLSNTDLLERCRLVPTSLLEENKRLLPRTGRFGRVENLIAYA